MSSDQIAAFQKLVLDYYTTFGRHDLPWRQSTGGRFLAYQIMVSEMMLQQTQVVRVIPKYQAFLELFPSVYSLAAAPLGDVLAAWSGLGYNRRAKYLQLAAQMVVDQFSGQLPETEAELTQLPGIGRNTAGAIMAYAYNKPAAFIETNIRSVYIHHFFPGQGAVTDKAILELVSQTMPFDDARQWYWALMDYGSHLKTTTGNAARRSQSHVRQSAFIGSRRQIRGQVIKLLTVRPHSLRELTVSINDQRLDAVVTDLVAEKLIISDGLSYQL